MWIVDDQFEMNFLRSGGIIICGRKSKARDYDVTDRSACAAINQAFLLSLRGCALRECESDGIVEAADGWKALTAKRKFRPATVNRTEWKREESDARPTTHLYGESMPITIYDAVTSNDRLFGRLWKSSESNAGRERIRQSPVHGMTKAWKIHWLSVFPGHRYFTMKTHPENISSE